MIVQLSKIEIINNASLYLQYYSMLQLLTQKPVPIYHIDTPTDRQSLKAIDPILNRFWLDWTRALDACPYFRCVAFKRLQTVLLTGVDVEPSNHHIYASIDYEKALEYGGEQKIMLVYHSDYLHHTCRKVSTGTSETELKALSTQFPTRLTSKDGTKYLFSRLPEGDTALGSAYELDYGRWIPGDPFEALKAIILIGQFSREKLEQASTGNQSIS